MPVVLQEERVPVGQLACQKCGQKPGFKQNWSKFNLMEFSRNE